MPDVNHASNAQLRQAAVDLVLRSYENHKSHSRFQETQRSWFLIAYFSVAGVIGAAVLNRLLQSAELRDNERSIMIVALMSLVAAGFLVGMAIVKVGVEFRRHYHQAEGIISLLQGSGACDDFLKSLLQCARLGTSGDENKGVRRFVAKRFGVAAIHNYLVSMIIGLEIASALALLIPDPRWAALAFPAATALAIIILHSYRKIIWDSRF